MAIALQTPLVTSVTNLSVLSLVFSFGPTDAQTTATLVYAPSNAQGNLAPGAAAQATAVQLAAADLAAFNANPGTPRQKAEAALQSSLGAAAAGSAT